MARNGGGREPRVRLADLAETAGVSIATVSRVLNGKDGVSDDARHAVLRALDLLGYERPPAISPKPDGLVGLVVPELTNPVFAEFATRLIAALANRGYTSLLCGLSAGGATEDDCVAVLVGRGVRGIVFVSGTHADTMLRHDHYRLCAEAGIRIVLINGRPDDIDAACFTTDDAVAVEQAVAHLRQLGHTRIALLTGPRRYSPAQRKIAAFKAAMGGAHGEAAHHVFESFFTVEGGHEAAVRALRQGHTALVCASDLMALGAVRGARSLGLDVPGDVSVVGYDDSALAVFFDPPLTTVRQPVAELVRAAANQIIQEIQGEPGLRTELLFRPEVVVRASTGPARAAD